MTKEELKTLAKNLNNGKTYGSIRVLHEALVKAGERDQVTVSRRTVEGWLQGRTIDNYWLPVLKRLVGGEVVLTREECARIHELLKLVPEDQLTEEDQGLVERLVY